MGQVRIIGGIHRSRVIRFSDAVVGLRPTPDRVRETIFNWLNQDLTGLSCLDLFAGSGALGFEAVSRGAKAVTFVENNKRVFGDLRENSQLLKLDNIQIILKNGLDYLANTHDKFDLIFLDPPYSTGLLNQALQLISTSPKVLKSNALIYIEYNQEPDLSRYTVIKSKIASQVNYALIHLNNPKN